jgi:hypothetical protein
MVIRCNGGEFRADVIFDGKEMYYFGFPYDGGKIVHGEEFTFFLVWDDQLGAQYTGDERIVKIIN